MTRFNQRLFLRTMVICLLELQSLAARTGGGVRSSSSSGSSSSLSTGAIVGIVLGCLLGTALLVIALCFLHIYCRRRGKKSMKDNSGNVVNTNTVADSNTSSHTNNGFLADEVNYNDKPPAYDEIPCSIYPN